MPARSILSAALALAGGVNAVGTSDRKAATTLIDHASAATSFQTVAKNGERDRRTAYEWAEFLGFSPYLSCDKLKDAEGTTPFYEATLGTGGGKGILENIPAQTAHLYLILATCATGSVPEVKNGWQFVRSWINDTVRADVYNKKNSCLVAFGGIATNEALIYADVSATYVKNGFFMPKSVKQHYDYIRTGVLLDCKEKRTIAVGQGAAGALAQIARAYADVEESWAFNSIKTIINGHGPSQSVLPHSIHAYTHLVEGPTDAPYYDFADHISQLPIDQPFLVYTQGANNFELREDRHALGSLDEATHKQTRKPGDEPKAVDVLQVPGLQNYTKMDDTVMTEMLLVETVRRVHLPYMALEILESLY